MRRIVRITLPLALCAAMAGCSGSGDGAKDDPFLVSCFNDLADVSHLAVTPGSVGGMESSYDRTGGNDDGHGMRAIKAGEEMVLADLKGPGCVRRMWFTGFRPEQTVRLYFDGERTPRVVKTFQQMKGLENTPPFVPPLVDDPCCGAISYLPMPYAKSLKITSVNDSKTEFCFYQINYDSFPEGTKFASFRPENAVAVAGKKMEEVKTAWAKNQTEKISEADMPPDAVSVTVAAGETKTVIEKKGPAVADEFRISLTIPEGIPAIEKNRLLRAMVLRVYWDGGARPGVEVPIGDFFCNGLRTRSFRSMPIMVEKNVYVSRFPMPFKSGMRIEIANEWSREVGIKVGMKMRETKEWNPAWNYFHAAWNQSTSPGIPHDILYATGPGHYVGCYLISTGMDGTWNILEGDECIFRDGELVSSMHGTGLEDYFNAAWYFNYGTFTTPFAGALEKAGIRTTQYRFHVPDPVKFSRGLRVNIEFGHGNASRGYMSSVAYWYAPQPVALPYKLPAMANRFPPQDPLERTSILCEAFERERANRPEEGIDLCREYAEKYPGTPEAELMLLRALAYKEYMLGYDAVKGELAAMAASSTNETVKRQIGMLNWYQESPSNCIIVAHVNGAYKLFLDGNQIHQGDSPIEADAIGVSLAPGRHVLCAEATALRHDPWFSMYFKARGTNFWTTGAPWEASRGQPAKWPVTESGGQEWFALDGAGGPFPWMRWFQFKPNAFVFAQYKKQLLGHPDGWAPGKKVFFRREFEIK